MNALVCVFLFLSIAATCADENYVDRIYDRDLYYAAESRNYPEDPDTLYVTMRGGGMKVFDLSIAPTLAPKAKWISESPVEGQDRTGDLMVVAELGRGPNGTFDTSDGAALHLFDIKDPLLPNLKPFRTISLRDHIDAILHVKFVRGPPKRPMELWAVCSGGFATTVVGAVVLVNLTAVASPLSNMPATLDSSVAEVSVLSTPILQPEGVMVAPANTGIVYIGGIDSHDMGIIDISEFDRPRLVDVYRGVGMQLVGATRRDQPKWHSNATIRNEEYLVYMAGWGLRGSLTVLNTSIASHPSIQCRTSPSQDLQLAMANRVKLYGDWALLPLETPRGGFGIVNIGNVMYDEPEINQEVSIHVPIHETKSDSGEIVSAKAYCLAISESGYVYLFIAETSAVYVYCLDDVLASAGVAQFSDHCSM